MHDRTEISDYLLGELDELDRARLEREMQEDPELRAAVDALRVTVARLHGLSDEAWEHVDDDGRLPARRSAEAGTDTRIRREPARVPGRRARGAHPRRIRFGRRGVLGALVAAAAVAVAVILAFGTGGSERAGTRVVLGALAGSPPGARATALVGPGRRVVLKVTHLAPTDRDHYYELWLMTDTTHLAAVGGFRVDEHGSARLSLPLPASPSSYRYLDVSLQHVGSGGSISSNSLLRGSSGGSS